MTRSVAPWRVTYTPGEWLVLSGPSMVVVMVPAPPRMSDVVNTLWDDILASRSVDALVKVFSQYGLDGLSDFAAFFWDAAGLHGMARGRLAVTDADTGEVVVDGSKALTWREESLGTVRNLRVGMQSTNAGDQLRLPLVVGAVMASAIHLSTDPDTRVRFPDRASGNPGGDGSSETATGEPPSTEEAASHLPAGEDRPAEVVGLGDETEMEPFAEPTLQTEPEPTPAHEPDPERGTESGDDIPMWTPPQDEAEEGSDGGQGIGDHGIGGLRFDADGIADHRRAAEVLPPQQPDFLTPVPPPTSTEQPQVLAVPCIRGHVNRPGSRACRICSAPVDSDNPRLINAPVLAGVHSNLGDFVNVQGAVVVGRSPNASKGPPGVQLMRVASPGSDISRNHLMVATHDWSIIVTDLNSTNGTTVLPVGGEPFLLKGGESVQVALGTVLQVGDGVSLRIEPPRG